MRRPGITAVLIVAVAAVALVPTIVALVVPASFAPAVVVTAVAVFPGPTAGVVTGTMVFAAMFVLAIVFAGLAASAVLFRLFPFVAFVTITVAVPVIVVAIESAGSLLRQRMDLFEIDARRVLPGRHRRFRFSVDDNRERKKGSQNKVLFHGKKFLVNNDFPLVQQSETKEPLPAILNTILIQLLRTAGRHRRSTKSGDAGRNI